MSERHPGKEHELPSFVPAWGHPIDPLRWGKLAVDVIAPVTGGFWQQEALTGESEPMFTCTHRVFIGFRLVRAQ